MDSGNLPVRSVVGTFRVDGTESVVPETELPLPPPVGSSPPDSGSTNAGVSTKQQPSRSVNSGNDDDGFFFDLLGQAYVEMRFRVPGPENGVEEWVEQHVLRLREFLKSDDIIKRLVDKVAVMVKKSEDAELVKENKVGELVEEKEVAEQAEENKVAEESKEGKVLAVADEKVSALMDKEVSPDSSVAKKKQRI